MAHLPIDPALAELAHERAVVRLWNEGISASGVAARLGWTKNRVSGLIHRMRRRAVIRRWQAEHMESCRHCGRPFGSVVAGQ